MVKKYKVRMTISSRMASVVCGTPPPPHMPLSLFVPSTAPQVPAFFPSLVISPGAGMWTARGEVPMRLKLRACLSLFSLFFLLEVEHHQGVRFSAINCRLIPKRQCAHALTLDLEKTRENVFFMPFVPHMQTSM